MSTTDQRLGKPGALKLLRAYYDGIRTIPRDRPWTIREVGVDRGVVSKLRDAAVVEAVDEYVDVRQSYRLDAEFADRIDAHEPRSPQLPCGHHGWHNCGDGVFVCAYEHCDAEFDRETIEAVIA